MSKLDDPELGPLREEVSDHLHDLALVVLGSMTGADFAAAVACLAAEAWAEARARVPKPIQDFHRELNEEDGYPARCGAIHLLLGLRCMLPDDGHTTHHVEDGPIAHEWDDTSTTITVEADEAGPNREAVRGPNAFAKGRPVDLGDVVDLVADHAEEREASAHRLLEIARRLEEAAELGMGRGFVAAVGQLRREILRDAEIALDVNEP